MPGLLISMSNIFKYINGLNNKLFHLNLLIAGSGLLTLKVTWNIIWAKLLSCNNFKKPGILSEAPLPPTQSCKMSLQSTSFLIQSPLTHSLLTFSPHKCVTSSTTFLLKKMFCPPGRRGRVWETLNPNEDEGINLLNQLTLSVWGTPGPVIDPGIRRKNPHLQIPIFRLYQWFSTQEALSNFKTYQCPFSTPI